MSPTYDWSGETNLGLEGEVILPGERFTTDKYHSDSDLGLVSHLPQVDPPPILTLFEEDIVVGTTENLEVDPSYERIAVYNNCGGVLNIYTNGDSTNFIPMVDNSFWILDNRKKNIGSIHLSGESAGLVNVSCDKNIL